MLLSFSPFPLRHPGADPGIPILTFSTTGLPNKVCPRLLDSVFWRSGEITQPRTSLIREPCTHQKIADDLSIALLDSTLGPLD